MKERTPKSRRAIGDAGEEIAASYLSSCGYVIVEKNFVYQHGEIDLIAKEGNILVFIEVKTRHNTGFGEPEESVTEKKQSLLRRTAEGYVQQNGLTDVECRFDVVSIVLHSVEPKITLFKNCF